MSNDYNNKRYYWIKLKDTFFTSDTVDFLMSQNDGANYVVLYQMLCLKTANTNGELSRQIGEVIIPFDIDKIHRDCKYFSIDTIRVALELYKKLGLIYEQENGILQITNFANLIGSESQNAVYKRQHRAEEKRLESVQQMSNKRLDIRDKIEDKDIYKEKTVINDSRKEMEVAEPKSALPAPEKPTKHKYGKYKNILLTEEEHAKLLEMPNGDRAIEYLSEYREYKGYKAKNDYLAIRKWVFNALKEEEQRAKRNTGNNKQSSGNPFLDLAREEGIL